MKKSLYFLFWLITTLVIFSLIPLLLIVYLAESMVAAGMWKKIILLVIACIVLASAFGYWFYNRKIGDPQKEYTVVIHPRDNAADLYKRLIESGLPVNRRLYSYLMESTNTDRQIKPGRYHLRGGVTHRELVMSFREGKPELSKVTIPEGMSITKMTPIIIRQTQTDSAEFVRLLKDTIYFKSFNITAPGFEGYLYPETYNFFPYEEPKNIITEMVRMFKSSVSPEMLRRSNDLKMSLNDVITLASMIEAEASDGAERELISSVFHNRLRLGWKLQCDPTVIYALGGLDRKLLRGDLDFDSPYNTYLYYGLPPGPICSPGQASIKAALYPAATNYTYFVANGAGQHVFTASLGAHNSATSRIKRQLKAHREN